MVGLTRSCSWPTLPCSPWEEVITDSWAGTLRSVFIYASISNYPSICNTSKHNLSIYNTDKFTKSLSRTKSRDVQGCVEEVPPVSKVSAGYEHNLALLRDGRELVAWGWNEHGNCGTGNTINCHLPANVKLKNDSCILDCFAGSGHSFAIILKK